MQGPTPPPHAPGNVVADFYTERALMISIGMSLSLVSLFFLALFLAVLRQALLRAEGPHGQFARAREAIPPERAAVFYGGGLDLTAWRRHWRWPSCSRAVVGLLSPVAFLLFLLFPVWVLIASVLLYRSPPPDGRSAG